MDELEVKQALEQLASKLEGKQAVQIKAELKSFQAVLEQKFNDAIEGVTTKTGQELKDAVSQIDELKKALDLTQKHADELDVKLQKKGNFQNKNVDSYTDAMVKGITDGFNEIKSVKKGNGAQIEIKAVGDMSLPSSLTGSSVFTYQTGVAAVPSQMINFSDLVPAVQSSTGTYIIYRETGTEGSISAQPAPIAGVVQSKTQKDYDFTAVTFNADYISGYSRFAKQMAQDLPFLTSFLPEALRRDYFKAENSIFYTALKAAATASTAAATVAIERMIFDMGQLEAADYLVNGFVVNPVDWATIAVTKPSDYSLPSIVTFINGRLTINGIPVYKASWMPLDEYMVGDWNMAKKIITDGLAVEFFEQDGDNVTKNLITARVESRTVLGIDRPDAFITGTITPAT